MNKFKLGATKYRVRLGMCGVKTKGIKEYRSMNSAGDATPTKRSPRRHIRAAEAE